MNPPEPCVAAGGYGAAAGGYGPADNADPCIRLSSLSTVRLRMDSVQQFLSWSLSSNTLLSNDQIDMVDRAALFSFSHNASSDPEPKRLRLRPPDVRSPSHPPATKLSGVEVKVEEDELEPGCKIVKLNPARLLAVHAHFCNVYWKGFKRDATLRMHMRAPGNQFKMPEALVKPEQCAEAPRNTRFSCPFQGCNQNKGHKMFQPLKSLIRVKNPCKQTKRCLVPSRKDVSVHVEEI